MVLNRNKLRGCKSYRKWYLIYQLCFVSEYSFLWHIFFNFMVICDVFRIVLISRKLSFRTLSTHNQHHFLWFKVHCFLSVNMKCFPKKIMFIKFLFHTLFALWFKLLLEYNKDRFQNAWSCEILWIPIIASPKWETSL